MPLSWNLGTLTSWNPLGHSRPVTGLLYLFFLLNYIFSLSLRGAVLKNCLPVLCFGASYFLIIFFDSVVQSDVLTVERVSTHEYQKQRVLFCCCFVVAYLTWIFPAFEPTPQPLLYRLQMSDALYLNEVSSCVLGEWLGTWACVRDRLCVVCSVEQDHLGGAGYDPRPIEGLLLTGAKYVTSFPSGEFSFKKTPVIPLKCEIWPELFLNIQFVPRSKHFVLLICVWPCIINVGKVI